MMAKTNLALIRYKKRKGEKKAAKPLLVEFKSGDKSKARPYNKNNKKHAPDYWLRRWFNNKY